MILKSCVVSTGILIYFCGFYGIAYAHDWTDDALRLSGESQAVYRRSVASLRSYKNLDTELRQAIRQTGPNTYLALDVITCLKRDSLFKDLLSAAKKDESGFFYLSLNSFFNSSHHDLILHLFQDALKNPEASASVKMVVLDTFGRIGIRTPVRDLNSLLEDESHPEVRSAALYYLRAFLKRNDTEYFALFNQFRENYRHSKTSSPLFSAQLDALSSELSPKGSKP